MSDYLIDGAFGVADGTTFDPATRRWHVETTPALSAGKIKSDSPELWLRLVKAPKLVDLIRPEWSFRECVARGWLPDYLGGSLRKSDRGPAPR